MGLTVGFNEQPNFLDGLSVAKRMTTRKGMAVDATRLDYGQLLRRLSVPL